MTMTTTNRMRPKAPTGIAGLDEITEGIGIDVETPDAFVRRGSWAFELDQATFAASSGESLAVG